MAVKPEVLEMLRNQLREGNIKVENIKKEEYRTAVEDEG